MPSHKVIAVPASGGLNREGWLTEVAVKMEAFFRGYLLKPYRVTCGWPSTNALGTRARRVGECYSIESSKGGVHEIFISPLLDQPMDVAGTLCHEIAHVAAGIDARHGKKFVEVCKQVGLTSGKPTAAGPGTLLTEKLDRLLTSVGPYPHQAIILKARKVRGPSSYRLRCRACGCRLTMTAKWFGDVGPPPKCACGGSITLVLPDDDEDGEDE